MPWIKVKQIPPETAATEHKADRREQKAKKRFGAGREMSAFEMLFSHRPESLAPFKEWENQIRSGASELSMVQREMIATVVSRSNGCIFCTIAHGRYVKKLTRDPALYEDLVRDFRNAKLAPADRVMLEFASKLSQKPGDMTPDDVRKLREYDFSDGAITDIVLNVSLMSAVNRMFKGLGEDISPKKLAEAARLEMPIPAHYTENDHSGD